MREVSGIIQSQIIDSDSDSDSVSSYAETKDGFEKMIKEEFTDQRFQVKASNNMWRDVEEYSDKLQETLWDVSTIFEGFMAKVEQMEKFWGKIKTNPATPHMIMNKLTREMTEGSEEGNNLFRAILAKRLENFGINEVEDALDDFVDTKEYEMREAEKERKESETEGALKIAQETFKEVFDGLKKELDELKVESEELRGELAALKKGERG